MESTGEEDAALSDFEDGDLEAEPVILQPNSSDDSAESLKKALLELESEKEARKAAEIAKANLESTFGKMKGLAHEAIKKRDEFSRQRDEALRQKEEAIREKESTAKQLDEALRLKEEASKQRDEILKQRNDFARQKDEILRQKDEATKARESSRSEIESTAQLLINGAEKITSKVGSIKSFNGGHPRTSKHTGLAAIAYGAMKRAEEIVEELVRQHEIITKGRNDVREQMEQRNIAIAIEVSQLEATITGLREELGNKGIESENLQKLVLNKDGRISELESDISEKLDQERKEYAELKRFADETEYKLKNLELKIEKQKPIVSGQSVYIAKAQECLKNMVQMIDASAFDQFEFSEPLFVSQDLDIDKDLVASSAAAIFISELTTMVEKKLIAFLEKQSKERKDLEDNIVNLEAEKRDISTLLRSALKERQVAETEGDGEYQTGSDQRKGTILQVAERDLVLDLSGGALVGNSRTEKGQDEFFGLASALEHIIRTSQLEIAELRHSLEASRTELDHLKVVCETQTKDLAAKVLHIKELEEKERAASENVEGLMMDIAAAEEEIARWRDAAEQEAAAGKAVMEEFQDEASNVLAPYGCGQLNTKGICGYAFLELFELNTCLCNIQIKTLRQDLEEMKQSLDEANSKLKSKEEMAAAAVAARDTAEKSLQLADERASRLRARIEELTRQLEELDGGDEQQNIRRMRYACWPLQWLGTGTLGTYFTAYRDANGNSAEMELSDPLL